LHGFPFRNKGTGREMCLSPHVLIIAYYSISVKSLGPFCRQLKTLLLGGFLAKKTIGRLPRPLTYFLVFLYKFVVCPVSRY
jgi:hypothetical protein